ncbi:hypothetical protein VUR80DRAFT_4240 [Thermomyces stellatus]
MLFSTTYGAYFILGSFNLIMGLGGFFVTETKGISLERMDELFGGAGFSRVEDIGVAAKMEKEVDGDVDDAEDGRESKV